MRDLLDLARRLGARDRDAAAEGRFDRATARGAKTGAVREKLAVAARAVAGTAERTVAESLFDPAGSLAGGSFSGATAAAGVDDFEVAFFLVVLPDEPASHGDAASGGHDR